MWKETRVPRAPENSFTGMEMSPKVRYPVQTDAAMGHLEIKFHPCCMNGAKTLLRDGLCRSACSGSSLSFRCTQTLSCRHIRALRNLPYTSSDQCHPC